MTHPSNRSLPPGIEGDHPAPIPRNRQTMGELDTPTSRGTVLLLAHCASISYERPSAFMRLEAALGDDFARMLVAALAEPQGRGGSASP